MLVIDSEIDAINEMERKMRINEDIIRIMTIKIDSLPTEPSPMMSYQSREEYGNDEEGNRKNFKTKRFFNKDRNDSYQENTEFNENSHRTTQNNDIQE